MRKSVIKRLSLSGSTHVSTRVINVGLIMRENRRKAVEIVSSVNLCTGKLVWNSRRQKSCEMRRIKEKGLWVLRRGLEVTGAASEKVINSRTRASAPMSCNEHIWPFSLSFFLPILPKSFMHMHQLMEKIDSNPTCFYLQGRHLPTPANLKNLTSRRFRTNTWRWSSAQQERAETGEVKTGKDLCASTCDRLDIFWGMYGGGVHSGNRTGRWERDTSSSGVITFSEPGWCWTRVTVKVKQTKKQPFVWIGKVNREIARRSALHKVHKSVKVNELQPTPTSPFSFCPPPAKYRDPGGTKEVITTLVSSTPLPSIHPSLWTLTHSPHLYIHKMQ